jgi:hypothetical protein
MINNNNYVTYNHLLFITVMIMIGLGIFLYSMLKHAIELQNKTSNILGDLATIQGYIDVDLEEKLSKLIWNQGITYIDLEIIKNSTSFGPGFGGLGEVTLDTWKTF